MQAITTAKSNIARITPCLLLSSTVGLKLTLKSRMYEIKLYQITDVRVSTGSHVSYHIISDYIVDQTVCITHVNLFIFTPLSTIQFIICITLCSYYGLYYSIEAM